MTPPPYVTRLRLEGAVLGAWGLLGTIVLLVAVPGATHGPVSTILQEIIVAALLATLGPRSVRRSLLDSHALSADTAGSGEPTPLWHIAAIVVLLTLLAGVAAGWDAGLRVTVGCVLVGLAQSVLLAGLVAREQGSSGRVYYRVKGSRILRGTRLGHLNGPTAAPAAPRPTPAPARP
ncbi:MAG TPA: hypothetical protein VFN48_03195 [Solirubrobacteraceae bacterium]|nr:hypothetical protein [Solirubrobacteraceae bacterium]